MLEIHDDEDSDGATWLKRKVSLVIKDILVMVNIINCNFMT